MFRYSCPSELDKILSEYIGCSSTLDNSITCTPSCRNKALLPCEFAIVMFVTRTHDLVTILSCRNKALLHCKFCNWLVWYQDKWFGDKSISYFPQTHKLIGTSQCNSYWALPNNSWSKIVDAIQISDCIDFIWLCDWTKIMKLIA